MRNNKRTILITSGVYLPGVKGGGPIRSISNIVNICKKDFNIIVVTRDRDLNDSHPYKNIICNKWIMLNGIKIYYLKVSVLSIHSVKSIFNINHDVLYINSFFSPMFAIIPLLLKRFRIIKNTKCIIAPRGEFSPEALKIKKLKKNIYLLLYKFLNLGKEVLWHASSKNEKNDIKALFPEATVKFVIPDPLQYCHIKNTYPLRKEKGELKLFYLSRICKIKNLLYLITLLRDVKLDITLNIYGPVEDDKYWARCLREINLVPKNIKINFEGLVEHQDIPKVFQENHVLILPTLGESFGHVIVEAMYSGCPVIISNLTPWRNLEQNKIGFDLPLENKDRFFKAIETFYAMNQVEFSEWSHAAHSFANALQVDNDYGNQLYELFN